MLHDTESSFEIYIYLVKKVPAFIDPKIHHCIYKILSWTPNLNLLNSLTSSHSVCHVSLLILHCRY
jgi:hypothetical protein